MIATGRKPAAHDVGGIGRSGLILWPFQIIDQGPGRIGQFTGIIVDIAVKPVLPVGINPGIINQNRRSGPDRGDGRNDRVQRAGQLRVMGQPQGQFRDPPLQPVDMPGLRGQQSRPIGETAGEILGPGQVNRIGGRGRSDPQSVEQRGLSPFGQTGGVKGQGTGQIGQQFATDSPAVVFDQVQIAGRNPRRLRQFHLPQAQIKPATADAPAGQRPH